MPCVILLFIALILYHGNLNSSLKMMQYIIVSVMFLAFMAITIGNSIYSYMGITFFMCSVSLLPLYMFCLSNSSTPILDEQTKEIDYTSPHIFVEYSTFIKVGSYFCNILILIIYAIIHMLNDSTSRYLGFVTLFNVCVCDFLILIHPSKKLKNSPFWLFFVLALPRVLMGMFTMNYWFLGNTLLFVVLFNLFRLSLLSESEDSNAEMKYLLIIGGVEEESEDLSDHAFLKLGKRINSTSFTLVILVIWYIVIFSIAFIKPDGFPLNPIQMQENPHEQWEFGVFGFVTTFVFASWIVFMYKGRSIPDDVVEIKNVLLADPSNPYTSSSKEISVENPNNSALKTTKTSNVGLKSEQELSTTFVLSFKKYIKQLLNHGIFLLVVLVVTTIIMVLITKSNIIAFILPSFPLVTAFAIVSQKLYSVIDYSNVFKENSKMRALQIVRHYALLFLISSVVISLVSGLLLTFIDTTKTGGLLYIFLSLSFIFNLGALKYYFDTLSIDLTFWVLAAVSFVLVIVFSLILNVSVLGLLLIEFIILPFVVYIDNKCEYTAFVIITLSIDAILSLSGCYFGAKSFRNDILFIVASLLAMIIIQMAVFLLLHFYHEKNHQRSFRGTITKVFVATMIVFSLIIGILILLQGTGIFWGVSSLVCVVSSCLFVYSYSKLPIDSTKEFYFSIDILPAYSMNPLTKMIQLVDKYIIVIYLVFGTAVVWSSSYLAYKTTPQIGFGVFFMVVAFFLAIRLKFRLNNSLSLQNVKKYIVSEEDQIVSLNDNGLQVMNMTNAEQNVDSESKKELETNYSNIDGFNKKFGYGLKVQELRCREIAERYLKIIHQAHCKQVADLTELSSYLQSKSIFLTEEELSLLSNEERQEFLDDFNTWKSEQAEINNLNKRFEEEAADRERQMLEEQKRLQQERERREREKREEDLQNLKENERLEREKLEKERLEREKKFNEKLVYFDEQKATEKKVAIVANVENVAREVYLRKSMVLFFTPLLEESFEESLLEKTKNQILDYQPNKDYEIELNELKVSFDDFANTIIEGHKQSFGQIVQSIDKLGLDNIVDEYLDALKENWTASLGMLAKVQNNPEFSQYQQFFMQKGFFYQIGSSEDKDKLIDIYEKMDADDFNVINITNIAYENARYNHIINALYDTNDDFLISQLNLIRQQYQEQLSAEKEARTQRRIQEEERKRKEEEDRLQKEKEEAERLEEERRQLAELEQMFMDMGGLTEENNDEQQRLEAERIEAEKQAALQRQEEERKRREAAEREHQRQLEEEQKRKEQERIKREEELKRQQLEREQKLREEEERRKQQELQRLEEERKQREREELERLAEQFNAFLEAEPVMPSRKNGPFLDSIRLTQEGTDRFNALLAEVERANERLRGDDLYVNRDFVIPSKLSPAHFKSKAPELYTDYPDYNDVKQGEIGDCYLISSIAAIASHANGKDLIDDIICYSNVEKGVFIVKLYHNFVPQFFVVDGVLPYGGLKYARSKLSQEMWVGILEKSFAMLNGSYQAIGNGGATSLGYIAFLRAVADCIFTKDIDSDKSELLLQLMIYAKQNHSVMFSLSSPNKGQGDTSKSSGIVDGHAFSLLDVATDVRGSDGKLHTLVKIRNPWGYQEWDGPFDDKSSLWTAKARKLLNAEDKDDGTWWMPYSLMLKNFTAITAAFPLNPNYGYVLEFTISPNRFSTNFWTQLEKNAIYITRKGSSQTNITPLCCCLNFVKGEAAHAGLYGCYVKGSPVDIPISKGQKFFFYNCPDGLKHLQLDWSANNQTAIGLHLGLDNDNPGVTRTIKYVIAFASTVPLNVEVCNQLGEVKII
eukprot:TRINITY_DN3092_c0_g1_i1.p1 TRINITY_DN3092_c0_g1~~TRINITY_DN3092_c0_g1_i1.p1  ORF type:complete len:1897 (+),score=572.46 TRINITY_DN3092_c0_g1_i1:247-5691(+)